MTLLILFIQYYSGILYDSACIGIVKNIKNKTFTQIKSHGKQYNEKLNGKKLFLASMEATALN